MARKFQFRLSVILSVKLANNNPRIKAAFDTLLTTFGHQHWWPGDSPWEIAVGAVLTQNTNWNNVEKAIANLKNHALLSPQLILSAPSGQLSDAIRPSGFFNLKTQRLHALATWWLENVMDDNTLKQTDMLTGKLRNSLLEVNGIGPETADSIILYAFNRPVFVIDAYTRRMASRHLNIPADIDYNAMQHIFMRNLPEDVQLYNEYHALIVYNAKYHCRKQTCDKTCPLHQE
ncbi:MAG: endonuclease III domain-containing protein [Victivallaceae bacterium]|nr:endonuclease III domain-containing protein [Victivallaceae bacterium]